MKTTVLHRNLKLLWLCAAPLVLAVLFAKGPMPHDFWINVWLASVLAFCWLWAFKPAARTKHAVVRADRHGLWSDGRLLLRRERISTAYLASAPDGLVCMCLGRFGTSRTEVTVDDEAQGRQLLRALSFDASQRAVRFAGPSPLTMTRTGRVIAYSAVTIVTISELLLVNALGHSPIGAFMFALWLFQAWLVAGGAAHVGADGVRVQSLWSRRFLHYGEIERVEPEKNGVRLVLRSGRSVDLWLGHPSYGNASRGMTRTRDALLARIAAEVRGLSEREAPALQAAMIGREGRTTAQWVDHLRQLVGASGKSYRTPAVEREQLWRIAEDTNAPPASRAGAAVALRDALKPEERIRLRVAAEAVAAPDVRAALEAAADEDCDDRALLRVLDPIARHDR